MPTTEALLHGKDRDSGRLYSEIVRDEEFLGSHVLRIQSTSSNGARENTSIRDSRGKAKQATTINGRTVILKDNMVYTNRGQVASSLHESYLIDFWKGLRTSAKRSY